MTLGECLITTTIPSIGKSATVVLPALTGTVRGAL